jgi:hypothetical protein
VPHLATRTMHSLLLLLSALGHPDLRKTSILHPAIWKKSRATTPIGTPGKEGQHAIPHLGTETRRCPSEEGHRAHSLTVVTLARVKLITRPRSSVGHWAAGNPGVAMLESEAAMPAGLHDPELVVDPTTLFIL